MIVGLAAAVAFILGGIGWYLFPGANKVLKYIEKNPLSTSLCLRVNGSSVVEHNANKLTPLASVVKIIIAIEYAEQAAAGELDPDAMVDLSELDKYYVPKTDGGAHSAFLKSVSDQTTDNQISLRLIAKGMIGFSSNANTEYLQQFLGNDKINQRLEKLKLTQHTKIYHLVPSMYVAHEMALETGSSKNLSARMRELSDAEYARYIDRAKTKLASEPEYKNQLSNIGMAVQKVWTDRLPASTAAEYISIAQKINSREYFSPQVQEYLSEAMESLMDSPSNQSWLDHSGQKGGSTGSLLTKVLYAKLKEGDSIELVYFMNKLKPHAMPRLAISMNAFELKVLTSSNFRREVIDRIGG